MAYAAIPATTGSRAGYKSDEATLAYGMQTAFATPATSGQLLRIVSETLNVGETLASSNEYDGTDSAPANYRTQLQSGGTLNGLLSAGTWDDFFAMLLGDVWSSAGTLGDSSNFTFATIQKLFPDGSCLVYPKAFPNKLTLTCNWPNGVTLAWDMMAGQELFKPAKQFATLANPSTSLIMKAGPSVVQVLWGTSPISYTVDQMTMTIERTNAARQGGFGSFDALGMNTGTFKVTVTFRVYYNGPSLYQDFSNEMYRALAFVFADGPNTYTFSMGKVRLSNPQEVLPGRGQDLMATFTALPEKDANLNTMTMVRAPANGVAGSFSAFAP